MSRHTRYALFDNGEGTVINMTFDGNIVAKFYDDDGKKLLGMLCQAIGRTDQMFMESASDYFRRFKREYGDEVLS
jgi:hypothetical protein